MKQARVGQTRARSAAPSPLARCCLRPVSRPAGVAGPLHPTRPHRPSPPIPARSRRPSRVSCWPWSRPPWQRAKRGVDQRVGGDPGRRCGLGRRARHQHRRGAGAIQHHGAGGRRRRGGPGRVRRQPDPLAGQHAAQRQGCPAEPAQPAPARRRRTRHIAAIAGAAGGPVHLPQHARHAAGLGRQAPGRAGRERHHHRHAQPLSVGRVLHCHRCADLLARGRAAPRPRCRRWSWPVPARPRPRSARA